MWILIKTSQKAVNISLEEKGIEKIHSVNNRVSNVCISKQGFSRYSGCVYTTTKLWFWILASRLSSSWDLFWNQKKKKNPLSKNLIQIPGTGEEAVNNKGWQSTKFGLIYPTILFKTVQIVLVPSNNRIQSQHHSVRTLL